MSERYTLLTFDVDCEKGRRREAALVSGVSSKPALHGGLRMCRSHISCESRLPLPEESLSAVLDSDFLNLSGVRAATTAVALVSLTASLFMVVSPVSWAISGVLALAGAGLFVRVGRCQRLLRAFRAGRGLSDIEAKVALDDPEALMLVIERESIEAELAALRRDISEGREVARSLGPVPVADSVNMELAALEERHKTLCRDSSDARRKIRLAVDKSVDLYSQEAAQGWLDR